MRSFANTRGFSKHQPAMPLYTRAGSVRSALDNSGSILTRRSNRRSGSSKSSHQLLGPLLAGRRTCWRRARGQERRTHLFGGDLWALLRPILSYPSPSVEADVDAARVHLRRIVLHPTTMIARSLAQIINETFARRASYASRLCESARRRTACSGCSSSRRGTAPKIPISVDSPMEIKGIAYDSARLTTLQEIVEMRRKLPAALPR